MYNLQSTKTLNDVHGMKLVYLVDAASLRAKRKKEKNLLKQKNSSHFTTKVVSISRHEVSCHDLQLFPLNEHFVVSF